MASTLISRLEEASSLRWMFAVASGVALGLSFPSFDLVVLSFVAILPLLLALRASTGIGESLILGWVSAMVTWLVTVPWVVNVMQIHGGIPLPIGIALYVAMSIYLGLYGGLFGVIAHRLLNLGKARGFFLVPFAWAAVEFLRAHLFAGFPWNLTAAIVVDLPLAQVARWLGPYAVGALLVAPSSILTWHLTSRTARWSRVTLLIVAYLAAWTFSGMAIRRTSQPDDPLLSTRVAVLQPNIPQEARWDPAQVLSIFERMTRLTEEAIGRGASVVVWPESTVPLLFVDTPFYRDWVEEASRESDSDVILGSVALDPQDRSRAWNAAYLVSGGEVRGRYDKMKLVPFGEFVPMRRLLFFAEKLVKSVGEFIPGANDEPLRGRMRYGMAICYEILFPHLVRADVLNGADILVTITNDAWFGPSAAPGQHLQSARLRAIETDRYMIRSATTGISAIVDPRGEIMQSIALDEEGTLVAEVAPRQSITPYVRFGDWFAAISIVFVAIGILFGTVRQGRA